MAYPQLFVVVSADSHQPARPPKSAATLEASLGNFGLERRSEKGRHRGPDPDRIEFARGGARIRQVRDGGADLSDAELMLAAQPNHGPPIWVCNSRHRERAEPQQAPLGMLQVQQRSLPIRVETGEIRERRARVAKTELNRRSGKNQRRRRLVAAEMRECVAGCCAERGTLRYPRIDAHRIVERTCCGESRELVRTPILVD